MSIMRISINCPSYKRPKVETLDYLSTCKVWVAQREYQDYLDANPEFTDNIIPVPDNVQGNVCRIRNYILNNELMTNDVVLLIDDDLHKIERFEPNGMFGYEKFILSEEELYDMLERYSTLCDEFGFKHWGIMCNQDALSYRQYADARKRRDQLVLRQRGDQHADRNKRETVQQETNVAADNLLGRDVPAERVQHQRLEHRDHKDQREQRHRRKVFPEDDLPDRYGRSQEQLIGLIVHLFGEHPHRQERQREEDQHRDGIQHHAVIRVMIEQSVQHEIDAEKDQHKRHERISERCFEIASEFFQIYSCHDFLPSLSPVICRKMSSRLTSRLFICRIG